MRNTFHNDNKWYFYDNLAILLVYMVGHENPVLTRNVRLRIFDLLIIISLNYPCLCPFFPVSCHVQGILVCLNVRQEIDRKLLYEEQ